MEILRVIKERRSIRGFLDKEIPDAIIERLIEALRWAPSAGNLQSRKFYFIKESRTKKLLAAAALHQSFISKAPLVVVACTDSRISSRYGQRGIELYSIQDVSVSVMSMMLVAHENGLGTCWVGAFREEEVADILKTPSYLRPVAIVPVGYPSESPIPPPRKPKEEIVQFVL